MSEHIPDLSFGELRSAVDEVARDPGALDRVVWLCLHAPEHEREVWCGYALDRLKENEERAARLVWCLEREEEAWQEVQRLQQHSFTVEPWMELCREDVRMYLAAVAWASTLEEARVQIARPVLFIAWDWDRGDEVQFSSCLARDGGGSFGPVLGAVCVYHRKPDTEWSGIPLRLQSEAYQETVHRAYQRK